MKQRKEWQAQREAQLLSADTLLAAVRWIVEAGILNKLKLHGNTIWKPVGLIILTVVWG